MRRGLHPFRFKGTWLKKSRFPFDFAQGRPFAALRNDNKRDDWEMAIGSGHPANPLMSR